MEPVYNTHSQSMEPAPKKEADQPTGDMDEYMLFCYMEEHSPDGGDSKIREMCQSIKKNYYNDKNN